ncbi:imelysin family protein [Loktanella sp. R86503]|uniref:imelysin family protein n=1 Tax=Loktanella sp. R86503 TaxID=3093847 RepID=UPI0036DD1B74
MKLVLTLAAALTASSAFADVNDVVEGHILPGYAAFDAAAADLRDAAAADCSPGAVRPAWNAAFDAWMAVSHLKFGPVEQDGASVIVAFWPDERSATPKALARLIADQDPIIETAEGTAQISVAARGIYALEYLLYDPQFEQAGQYGCALTQALTADLAAIAARINQDWQSDYADTMRSAGEPGNQIYLSEKEATQALFTALLAGLDFNVEQRLARPLGTFDRPRPNRAEAWRSGRSQRNIVLSLQAMADMAQQLTDGTAPVTQAAMIRAIELAEGLDDPILAGVDDPSQRLKIEIVQQAITTAYDAVLGEIGATLGVSAGFNSADGD